MTDRVRFSIFSANCNRNPELIISGGIKMNRNAFISLVLIVSLCLPFTYGGCSGGSGGGGGGASGSWYKSGFHWPANGEPFESENFKVFTDSASYQVVEEISQLAEDALADIEQLFDIDADRDFLFPLDQDKIDIYVYESYSPWQWGGWSYYAGLLIYSLDHPLRSDWGHTDPTIFILTLTHETMHAVESLLKASNDPRSVDVWLTEGIAEAVSGGTAGGVVTDLARLNELRQTYGMNLNPVAMFEYDYPDIDGVVYNYYYPMFQLAVEYLVDPNGHGRSYVDLKNLFMDVSVGVSFETAFQNRMGISVQNYEAQFFALMNGYLQ